jgi:hypothetical protein
MGPGHFCHEEGFPTHARRVHRPLDVGHTGDGRAGRSDRFADAGVDPSGAQPRGPTVSPPPPVEGIEGKAAAPPPRLLAPAVVLDHALAVLGAHLLITGRPVQVEDSAVDPNPEVENQEPIATPLAYHPATLFEVAMGAVIVFVALSLVWLPRLRSERPRRHRRRPRAGSHRRYTNSRSTRDPAPGQKRTRVRRRSRRATAD